MVAGATRVSVATAEAADALVKKAAAARAVEATAMNATSSRSHSIFMLYIQGQHAATGERLHGMLNLVDLAGRSVWIFPWQAWWYGHMAEYWQHYWSLRWFEAKQQIRGYHLGSIAEYIAT
jgi:hypothetical protein